MLTGTAAEATACEPSGRRSTRFVGVLCWVPAIDFEFETRLSNQLNKISPQNAGMRLSQRRLGRGRGRTLAPLISTRIISVDLPPICSLNSTLICSLKSTLIHSLNLSLICSLIFTLISSLISTLFSSLCFTLISSHISWISYMLSWQLLLFLRVDL